jgi:hypothetical protein
MPSPHELSDISMPLTGAEDGNISNQALPGDGSEGNKTEQPSRMSSSDEKESSVAKTRRKEQNRAA